MGHRISNFFDLEEFVPKETFESFGMNSRWFIDPRLVKLADFVREYFKVPITINNWVTGGQYNYSGYRPPECTVGATKSQHRHSRAMDLKLAGITPQAAYATILREQDKFMLAGLTTMEDIEYTKTWLHTDIRWTEQSNILIVKP